MKDYSSATVPNTIHKIIFIDHRMVISCLYKCVPVYLSPTLLSQSLSILLLQSGDPIISCLVQSNLIYLNTCHGLVNSIDGLIIMTTIHHKHFFFTLYFVSSRKNFLT